STNQLNWRDQPVIAFQELIAFLVKSLVEFFELVDLALQASDFTFELVHSVLVFGVLAPQLGIVLLKDFHQIVIIASQILRHRASLAVRADNGGSLNRDDAGCCCLCFSVLRLNPLRWPAPTIL